MTFGIELLTFGDGSFDYRMAAKRLADEARSTKCFSGVAAHNLLSIRKRYRAFLDAHKSFIRANPRGLGFWLWKPFLISMKLSEMREGDVLLYCDAGCEITFTGRSELLSILPPDSFDCSLLELPGHSVGAWTNDYTLAQLGIEEEIQEKPQFAAGLLALRNNNSTRQLCRAWLKTSCEDDYQYLVDRAEVSARQEFIEHRHDQSILTVVVYEAIRAGRLNVKYFNYFSFLERGMMPVHYARNRTGWRSSERSIPSLPYRVLRKPFRDFGLDRAYMSLVLR